MAGIPTTPLPPVNETMASGQVAAAVRELTKEIQLLRQCLGPIIEALNNIAQRS